MAEVEINFDWSGVEGVRDKLDRLAYTLEPPELTEHVSQGADVFVGMMRQTVPKGETLELMNSIDKHQDGETAFLIYPHTIYARVQDQGADNHPVNAPFMVFDYRGNHYRAKTVHIPATHYVEEAFDLGVGPATEAVKASITRSLDL